MGIYDDLIPKGSSGAGTATATPKPGGIYADLIPPPAAPTPPPVGPLQKVADFFTGKQEPAAPPPVVAPTPPKGTGGIFKDLIPAPTPPPVAPPTIGSKIAAVGSKMVNAAESLVSPPDESTLGTDANANTLKYLPSEIIRRLPLGIGAIITQVQDDPETAARLTFGDLPKATPGAIVDYGKDVIKGLASAGLGVAGVGGSVATGGKWSGQMSFKIPGLGDISNPQINTAVRVANGEDPVVVALEEGSAAIFNTLFFADIMARPFVGRPVKTAEFNANANDIRPRGAIDTGPVIVPKGTKAPAPIDYGPKSFRLYQQPTVTNPLPPQLLSQMKAQGIDLGENFKPNLPTYFRVSGGKGGSLTGEIIQVKPSWYRTIVDSLSKKSTTPVEPADVAAEAKSQLLSNPDVSSNVDVLHSQTVNIKDVEAAAKTPVIRMAPGVAAAAPPEPGPAPTIPGEPPVVAPSPAPASNPDSKFADLIPKQEEPVPAGAPATAEEAAQRYYDEKVKPALDSGGPVVLGGDDLKDHFGGDYADSRHPIYSKATFQLYERVLKENPDPEVVLLGGGPGSGKTELIVKNLIARGFKGILYDSNLANYAGAKNQIEAARAAGKDVRIYGITPDLEKARGFTFSREAVTGRGVTDAAFARGHAGFPDVVGKLINDGVISADRVHILDTRGTATKEEAIAHVQANKFVTKPVEHMRDLGYNEEHVRSHYSKESVTRRNKQNLLEQRLREESSKSPDKNRPDTTGHGGGDRGGTRQGVDEGRKATASREEHRFGKNDTVKLTDKETGQTQSRVVKSVLADGSGLVVINEASGIPNKALFDKWDIELVKKGDVSAPLPSQGITFGELAIREMVDETKTEAQFNALSSKDQEKVFPRLPQKLQDEILGAEPSPVDQLVHDIASGRQKLSVGSDIKTEKIKALGKGNYARIFRKNDTTLPSLDEVASDAGISSDRLLSKLSDALFARKEMRMSGNASIGTFRDGTPLKINTDKIKLVELPEMVQLAKMLMGQVPKIRQKVSRHFGGEARGVFIGRDKGEIRLRADLFDPAVSDINQAAKTLAHEIGHLIDYLPEGTLTRGNILGRLLTLRGFRQEFLDAAGASRSAKDIKEELWQLSKYWKPIDEETASKSFLDYRKSGKEVYADFISVLFNDPQLAMDRSPAAYNLFFENLDKKPAVRDAFFEIQSMLSGERADIVKARRTGVQQMFKDGDYKAIDLQNERDAEREKRNSNLLFKLKFELVDKNQALIDRVHQLEKQGVHINPDDNPLYTFEERNYLGGKIKAIVETDFNPVYQDLVKADVPWSTFGEALFYERIIAGDRSSQANPRGITVAAAEELYTDLKDGLLPKQQDALSAGIVNFRAGLRKVAEEAFQEGLYTPDLYKQMQENPAYVTFQVIDHLDAGMSSKVYRSIGTFKDITNPADASILKMIATVKAIERNKVTRAAVDFLKQHFPEEIESAKSVYNGKNGTRFLDSKQPYQDTVILYRNGKAEGHYIDPYIKKSIDNESMGQSLAVIHGLKLFNGHVFRPLFIGFNVGFQSFNFVRDFSRFWKNIPDMTLGRAMSRYIQAYPLARTRAFGPKIDAGAKWDQAAQDLVKLEREQVFAVTFNDIINGEAHDDSQIERIMRTSGIESFQPETQHKALKPFIAVLDFIKRTGDLIETLPKAAGFYEITDGKPLMKEDKSYIRKYLGSPDFLAGGHLKPATNEIFLFSNAITQGVRADYEMAFTNPKTRGAYWYKTMKLNILPKILMAAAAIGVFGAQIKKMMDDASEYDKTNYIVVPMGQDSTGKTIYFRFPQDETGRLIGGIAWKMLNFGHSGESVTTNVMDIGSFAAGQLPNISPAITAMSASAEFMAGQNPYDPFRGRTILSDDVFAAGGWRADKAFLGWMFNELGGGIIMRFANEQAVPQEAGPAEKFFNAPIIGNIVGRFFRVTDFGTTETLQKIQKKVAGQEAEQRLENKDLINSYVRKYENAPGTPDQRQYELDLVKEKFGGKAPTSAEDVVKAKSLISSFRLALVKGSSPAEIDALVSSTSNAQKSAILVQLKSTMTAADYKALLDKAVEEKVVSPEVAHKAK